MGDFFSKYGWTIVEIIAGIFSVSLILFVLFDSGGNNPELFDDVSQPVKGASVEYDTPYLDYEDFKVEGAILEKDSEFNWKDYVSVRASNGLDLEDYVTVTGYVDTSVPGDYTLLFEVNFNGEKLNRKAVYYVREGSL